MRLVAGSANDLVRERFLLPKDAATLKKEAAQSDLGLKLHPE